MIPEFARCPKCFAFPFVPVQPQLDKGIGDLECRSCGTAFSTLDGVAILCCFDHTDSQTVVETLAVKERTSHLRNETAAGAKPICAFAKLLDRWAGVDAAYGEGSSRDEWWLQHRRVELVLAQTALTGVPIAGALTLDVGAGSGADSAFYASRGARVIALEPNLVLLSQGRILHPELLWIGGSADALPVADETMDVVTANASLHHHLNVETSLDEMLRVLKPGGWLLTVADTVKGSSNESVEVDYKQWDTHPAVLSGVNEQILRLDVLLNRLEYYGTALEGEVFIRLGETGEFVRCSLSAARQMIQKKPRLWGIMAMRVRKLRSVNPVEHRMRTGAVPTPDLVQAVLGSDHTADGYQQLSRLLLAGDLRASLPLREVSRFLQLNGWRWPLEAGEWRLLYRRGRLYMRPSEATRSLKVVFSVPAVSAEERAVVRLSVNGLLLHEAQGVRGQIQHWQVPVSLPCAPCCVCLELVLPVESDGSGGVLPERHLAVAALEFAQSAETGFKSAGLLSRASLAALAAEGQLGASVTVWAGALVESALDAVGRLRQRGYKVSLYAAPDCWPFYAGQFTEAAPAPRPESNDLVLICGMTLSAAHELSAGFQCSNAWYYEDGFLRSLTMNDPFESQLDPVIPPVEAGLRRQLARQVAKLAEAKGQMSVARERIERLKQEAARRKKNWWRRLLAR